MRVIIHPDAGEELRSAALWYDTQRLGLGLDFLNEFEKA
jgi:hypothetical protein